MSTFDHLEFAKKKIELAKLEHSEIHPVVQALSIDFREDLCLLQLNPELETRFAEGKGLIIRGDLNDQAVICTDDVTYELKEAETSNSLLLLPDIIWPAEENVGQDFSVVPQVINSIFHDYYEIRRIKPSFKKLRILLERTAFKGNEYEGERSFDEILEKKLTFEDLLETIQSSEEELKRALSEMQTFILDGYVRTMDFDYKYTVVSSIISTIESSSLPFDKILKDNVIDLMQDSEPKIIVDHCFSWFTKDTEVTNEEGQKLYALNEGAICRLYGEFLLRIAGKFHLEEFLESWQKSVPEGLKCDLEHLRGLALTDTISHPAVIFHFPTHELPENIRERFDKLFRVKVKWTFDEIVPYLEDKAQSQNEVKALLVKYTRESTKNEVKMYSSKW